MLEYITQQGVPIPLVLGVLLFNAMIFLQFVVRNEIGNGDKYGTPFSPVLLYYIRALGSAEITE